MTRLAPSSTANLAPVKADAQGKNQLAIATYNVENLAPTDPDSKFQRLAQGVVTNLASPDIVAVEEVQDNDGAANPARVTFVDRGAASVNRSTTGTQVVKSHGEPDLTLSPGRLDPTNPVWTASRKPLVGEFSFKGQPVFVVANHFDAKLGDQNADGRFQFPAQSSATQRAGQASVEHAFVQNLLSIDPKSDVVVVGDLNDYQFSPSLNVLKTGTADGAGDSILTDLIGTLPVNQQYTYVFDGISEVLDHILVSKGPGAVQYQVVHVNAEYADQASDHDPQVVRFKP